MIHSLVAHEDGFIRMPAYRSSGHNKYIYTFTYNHETHASPYKSLTLRNNRGF